MHVFSNRLQMMSKCGQKKKKSTQGPAECVTNVLTHFDVFCDLLLLNRPMATWNQFAL